MNVAVLLAAGSGTRMGESISKQFIKVKGLELFLYSLMTFAGCKAVQKIIMVTKKEDIEIMRQIIKEHDLEKKIMDIIPGGECREESVKNAIDYLCEQKHVKNPIVVIHDAARPLVNEEIILNNIVMGGEFNGAVTAIPASDSILAGETVVDNELDRNRIWLAQTPQTFRLDILKKAFEKPFDKATDDCGMVINIGVKPTIVLGSKKNFKITTKEDLVLLDAYLDQR